MAGRPVGVDLRDSGDPMASPRRIAAALAAFAGLTVLAGVLILRWNRRQWFFLDEWDFLAGRDLRSGHDLLTPHNEHWSTIPIVIYRVLWRFVGLHHYWPYQVVVVAAHLAACALLRAVMRRAGVGPWIATVAAGALLFFGRGREDLVWGFQIGFTGALVLGLLHLLAADHDGPFDRRDVLGLAAGLGALMCSGVGVAMVAVAVLAVLLRRGWRAAAAHAVPLAALFVAWRVLFPPENETPTAGFGEAALLYRRILGGAFEALAGSAVGGVLLAAWLAVAVLALVSDGVPFWRGRWSATAACALGAAIFPAVVAPGRAGLSLEPAERYLHVTAALLLPPLALAASELARRHRWTLPVVLVILGLGVPSNVDRLGPGPADAFTMGNRQVLVQAEVALESGAPRGLRLQPGLNDGLTVGWLVDGRRSGRIPPPPRPMDPAAVASARLLLSLEPVEPPRTEGFCRPIAGAAPVRVRPGQRLRAEGDYLNVTQRSGASNVTIGYFLLAPDDAPTGRGRLDLKVLRPMQLTASVRGAGGVRLCSS